MSEKKHTPGPWVWRDDQLHNKAAYEAYERAFEAARDEKGDVAWVDVADRSEPIIETDSGVYGPFGADRDLIAAAPELYEALKNLVGIARLTGPRILPQFTEAFKAADAALAKAEGRL